LNLCRHRILLFGWMTVKIEKIQIKERGVQFNSYFDSATGLDRSSPVRVAGIHVGNVEQLALEEERQRSHFMFPRTSFFTRMQRPSSAQRDSWGRSMSRSFPDTRATQLEANATVAQGAPPVDMEQFLSQVGALRDECQRGDKAPGRRPEGRGCKEGRWDHQQSEHLLGQLNGLGKEAGQAIQKAVPPYPGSRRWERSWRREREPLGN